MYLSPNSWLFIVSEKGMDCNTWNLEFFRGVIKQDELYSDED